MRNVACEPERQPQSEPQGSLLADPDFLAASPESSIA